MSQISQKSCLKPPQAAPESSHSFRPTPRPTIRLGLEALESLLEDIEVVGEVGIELLLLLSGGVAGVSRVTRSRILEPEIDSPVQLSASAVPVRQQLVLLLPELLVLDLLELLVEELKVLLDVLD